MGKAYDQDLKKRLERCLVKLAMMIEDGHLDVAPIFRRIEGELNALSHDKAVDRARSILAGIQG